MAPKDNDKTAAEVQNEAFGGVDNIIDPGPGYPQIVGEPSADAKAGTPLDPDGHVRIAKDAGRTTEAVEAARGAATPIHLDDPEQAAEVNEEAVKAAGDGDGGTDKARRGPKEKG